MTEPPASPRRVDRQFQIAVDLVARVEQRVDEGVPADAVAGELIRRMPAAGSRDRRRYRDIIFAYFRWLGWTSRIAPESLHHRCAWALLLDSRTDDDLRACGCAVAEISDTALRQITTAHGIVALGIAASRITECPALKPDHLVPAWMPDVFPDATARLLFIESIQHRPPTWLMVPSHDVEHLTRLLDRRGTSYRRDSRRPEAIAVEPPFPVVSIEQELGAALQVQDIASQCVVAACAARAGDRWWDACSGSGGKTLGLARSTGPGGRVVATDIRTTILKNLRDRADAHRLPGITTLAHDATAGLPPDAPFDGVLVDAPCSGLGTWSRNPDARWRLSVSAMMACRLKQQALLAGTAGGVRKGGVLIYAVCSPAQAEGEAAITAFLAQQPGFRLDDFAHPLTGHATGGMITLWPHEGPGDGMFIARMINASHPLG